MEAQPGEESNFLLPEKDARASPKTRRQVEAFEAKAEYKIVDKPCNEYLFKNSLIPAEVVKKEYEDCRDLG